MKKLTKNRLIAGMVLSAAFVAAIGVANHAIYTADAADAETGIAGNFAMTDGMSIRKENPVGLRFATSVDSDFRASLEEKYSPEEYVYEFGTVLTVGEKQTIAPIKQWKDEAKTEYTMVIYEIPETDYATEISAKGYVTVYAQTDIDKETAIYTQYTSNEVSRSAAYVASAALNNGESGDALINYLKPVAKGITLSESKVTLSALNETKTLAATTNPVDYKAVWSSSNNSIVSVDKNGVITAKDYGKATITAKFGDHTATCEVSVPITADPLGFVAINGATVSEDEKGEKVIKVVTDDGQGNGFKDVLTDGVRGKFFDCGYTYVSFDMYVESSSNFLFNTSKMNIWTSADGYEWKDNDSGKQGQYLRSYVKDEYGYVRKPLSKNAWFTMSMRIENWSDTTANVVSNGGGAVYYLKNLRFGTDFPQEREKRQTDSLAFAVDDTTGSSTIEKETEGDFANTMKFTAKESDMWSSKNHVVFSDFAMFQTEGWEKIEFEVYFAGQYGIAPICNANSWWHTNGNFEPSDANIWNYISVTNAAGESVKKLTSGQWYKFTFTPKGASGAGIGFDQNAVAYFRNLRFL